MRKQETVCAGYTRLWSHLADDLAVLRYEHLHGGPLGRSPQHTHCGYLPGWRTGELGEQTRPKCPAKRLNDADWWRPSHSASASPGNYLSPKDPSPSSHLPLKLSVGVDRHPDLHLPSLPHFSHPPCWAGWAGLGWGQGQVQARREGKAHQWEGAASSGAPCCQAGMPAAAQRSRWG